MANYYGVCRTNYFKVTNPDRLKEIAGLVNATLTQGQEKGVFALLGKSEDGSMSHYDFGTDEQKDLVELLAPILTDDSICVLVSSGHEKLRYVIGTSIAFNNKGETVSVNTDDIYKLANEKFQIHPTIAEY